MVTCNMLGNPPPRISWSYYFGAEISTNRSDRVHYLPTGELVFDPILAKDRKNYNCTGTNLAGSGYRIYAIFSVVQRTGMEEMHGQRAGWVVKGRAVGWQMVGQLRVGWQRAGQLRVGWKRAGQLRVGWMRAGQLRAGWKRAGQLRVG